MKRLSEIIVLSILTIAWWGTFYPDLSLSKDICKIVYENAQENEDFLNEKISIFSAKPGQVRVKSHILEYLKDAF